MSWQRIELNMIPDTKVLPVVHASQFDSNRSISFQMFTGEDEWTIPEGLTIELHCRKVDDNIVTLSPLSVDGSVITFITTEQLTACSGQNKCELSFIDADELVIGSLNFILDVEADPLAGGVTSETEIDNLTQQIEDIATEVIGEDYYDKTEVDALLNDKADVSDLPDMSLYYTKTATDTLLNAKADAATTYTKSETDSLLSAKANTADLATVATTGDYDDLLNKPVLPDMTQYYTKAEVDDIVDDMLPVDSSSGPVATVNVGLVKKFKNITVDENATTITLAGKNLIELSDAAKFNSQSCSYVYQDNGIEITVTGAYGRVGYSFAVKTGATYTISFSGASNSDYNTVYFNDAASWSYSYGIQTITGTLTPYTKTITATSDILFIGFYVSTDGTSGTMSIENIQLESGSTATAFEVMNSTTYPVTDKENIQTLSGINNVYTDYGDTSIQAQDTIQHYIDVRT